MNVVFFDHCAKMSGAEIALLNTLPSLEGITSTVLLGENGPLVSNMKSSNISVSVVKMPTHTREFDRMSVGISFRAIRQVFSVLGYSFRVARHIRQISPDVVVSNSMKGHVILSMASPWFSAPLLFHVRDRISTDFMSRGGVVLERFLMSVIPRGIVANSESTLSTVPSSLRQKVRKVVASPVLNPGYSINGITSRRDNSAIRLGVVGRLTEWKGQELAIRAFFEAFPDGHETLEIVGGPLFGEEEYELFLKGLCEELELTSRITFSGHVDNVFERMRNWDILVHCSIIPEPFGQVVVQGMAAGLAVIASGEGGPLETIEHEETGYLFEPRDQKSLVLAMKKLAGNRELRQRLAMEAQAEATRYFPKEIGIQMKEALVATATKRSDDPKWD